MGDRGERLAPVPGPVEPLQVEAGLDRGHREDHAGPPSRAPPPRGACGSGDVTASTRVQPRSRKSRATATASSRVLRMRPTRDDLAAAGEGGHPRPRERGVGPRGGRHLGDDEPRGVAVGHELDALQEAAHRVGRRVAVLLDPRGEHEDGVRGLHAIAAHEPLGQPRREGGEGHDRPQEREERHGEAHGAAAAA